ncbi:MAG: hypothetical protein PGN23_06965 [Sphingomonas adhaesiva]|uniref:hypothetical protein n=1 Tax=Sphingomonas adhaesiva TaxID=28212 RepID=UPI002FF7A0D6
MLKLKAKRIAVRNAESAMALAGITASVVALDDEDLLDLADIFARGSDTPLGSIARTEMARRGISL